jgi:alanine-synthesizing transaminase
LRRDGEDVIDLGFGNPDVPSPDVAVEKLSQAAQDPRNHRYSASRGIPNLRRAICDLYARRFGVELDPDREAITTIGAKEGLTHLMWLLVEPGDVALVPDPSYPIHRFAPLLAGGSVEGFRLEGDLVAELEDAYARAAGRARTVVVSFPHNPTGAVATLELMQQVVDFARERGLVAVHDFAYADLAYDGHEPSSILQADGAREVAIELYSLTKGFSMAGWRVGFAAGNADILAGLARLKSYLDYGTFQPIQIAAIVAMNEARDYPLAVCELYRARRDALCRGLASAGWPVEPPKGTMFVWAAVPERFRDEGSQAFALRLLREARVAVSPGAGFGPAGEGHVRFALVENEQRIQQAVRGIRGVLRA